MLRGSKVVKTYDRVTLPLVQVLEGTMCTSGFKVADYSKVKLPKLNLEALDTKEQYDQYKTELYKLNDLSGDDAKISGFSSSEDHKNLLVDKKCDELKLSYNSVIPDLNDVTDLDFIKQGESKWSQDLIRGMKDFELLEKNPTNMIAIQGDVDLSKVEEKAENLAHFLFMGMAIDPNFQETIKDKVVQGEVAAFGSYFNASNTGFRNHIAMEEMNKLTNTKGFNNFLLPWGANHNPHFEELLKEDNYRLTETSKIVFAKCSDFYGPTLESKTFGNEAAESMYNSFCK